MKLNYINHPYCYTKNIWLGSNFCNTLKQVVYKNKQGKM